MSADGRPAPAVPEQAPAATDSLVGAGRKWTITGSVMLVTVMQVLDVTVTNVALPHIQGSLSAGARWVASIKR